VQGLVDGGDGLNRQRKRRRPAGWQNSSPGLGHDLDGLSHRYFRPVEDFFELGRLRPWLDQLLSDILEAEKAQKMWKRVFQLRTRGF
jgi:hypothetical protein